MTHSRQSWSHPSVVKFLKEQGSDDPVARIRELSRELASKAFDDGWSGPPFSPFHLAKLLGVDIVPQDSVLDARTISIEKNHFKIEYNPNERPSRINFSISHEIGHTLFSDCAATIRNREVKKDPLLWELEFLCDIAAAEFVLPYSFFARDAQTTMPRIKDMIGLADKYSVSLQAVLLRYIELAERPCALIMAANENPDKDALIVSYFKRSGSFELKLDKGVVLPPDSKAHECINPGWSSSGVENWPWFRGTRLLVESIGLPPLKHSTVPRVGILVSPDQSATRESAPTLNYVLGDATHPRSHGNKIIAQVVNSGAALGAGFGRSMAKAWPESVVALKTWKTSTRDFVLGSSQLAQLDRGVFVLQMFAQKGVTSTERSISLRYTSLRKCLAELGVKARELHASVHMPRIGAGQAGGDWSIIEGMIYEEIISQGVTVTVYDLPGSKPSPRKGINLSLFETT